MDSKEEHAIVAVKPKPPFRPIFQVATTREGSGVMLIKEASERWSGGLCVCGGDEGGPKAPKTPTSQYDKLLSIKSGSLKDSPDPLRGWARGAPTYQKNVSRTHSPRGVDVS